MLHFYNDSKSVCYGHIGAKIRQIVILQQLSKHITLSVFTSLKIAPNEATAKCCNTTLVVFHSWINQHFWTNWMNKWFIDSRTYLMPFYMWNIVHDKSNMSEFTVIIKKVGQNVPRWSTTTFTEDLKCASDG